MAKSPSTEPEFGKLRAAIWPIHGGELKKFLPMALIMFFVLFNYTILRNAKDALIVTAPGSGAEVVTFLKFWGVMPCSILFVVLYAKMSNALNKENLFYATVAIFIAFFAAFALYLYPNKDMLHPDPASIEALKLAYPNFQWFFPMFGVWTYSLFYIMAELWGSVILTLSFWQFANEITRTTEAKRFYPMFGLLANVSLLGAGSIGKYFTQMHKTLPAGVDSWGIIINYMMASVVAAGVAILVVYWWMNRNVLTNVKYYDGASAKAPKKSKAKLSIGESFSYLMSSRYLMFVALLVLGYGMSINLVEVTWKSQVKLQFPDPKDYMAFMSDFSFWTGLAVMSILITTKGVIRKFGWYTGAMLTPLMILATSILFFAFVIFRDSLGGAIELLGSTPVFMAVMMGAAQNILSKGTKYSLFDPTKEMAYIPLDDELKVKGKAAVDVIGGRLGKSGGGAIQQGLLVATAGTQLTIAPYLMVFIAAIILAWIYAVGGLSKQYHDLLAKKDKEAA